MDKSLLTLLMLLSLLCSLHAEPLKVGAALPAVSGVDQNNQKVDFSSLTDEKWLLVFFYPKAHTGGCIKQACSLRDSYEQLSEEGVKVIGVSNDSVKSQQSFTTKYKLPFTLIADKDAAVIKAFGVPTFKIGGMAARQAYLFKDGKLVWRDLSASTKQQAADVLAQIRKKTGKSH